MRKFDITFLFADGTTTADTQIEGVSRSTGPKEAAEIAKRDADLTSTPTSIVVFEGRSVTNFDYQTLEATFSA